MRKLIHEWRLTEDVRGCGREDVKYPVRGRAALVLALLVLGSPHVFTS